MSQVVIDNPVINSPFEEAQRHCLGLAVLADNFEELRRTRRMFQSLLSWISRFGKADQNKVKQALTVSILVVLD